MVAILSTLTFTTPTHQPHVILLVVTIEVAFETEPASQRPNVTAPMTTVIFVMIANAQDALTTLAVKQTNALLVLPLFQIMVTSVNVTRDTVVLLEPIP